MPENDEVKRAYLLFSQGKKKDAEEILWPLSGSPEPMIKINAVLTLLVVLDGVRENDKLLEVVAVGIDTTEKVGMRDVYVYLLSKKCVFLANRLSMVIHRQKCLMLSAGVFNWIGFSLERDRREYDSIVENRKEIEREIGALLTTVHKMIEGMTDHYSRGNVFSSIADYYSLKYFSDHLNFMRGGRMRSKIANLYIIRRWGLDKFLYERKHRLQIRQSSRNFILYSEMAIAEYEASNAPSELAHAIYNLAVKYNSIFSFRKARKLLARARIMASSTSESRLLEQITFLEKKVADKNRHIPNYVEEMGLDLP